MKKLFTLIFVMVISAGGTWAQFAGGDGTSTNPYQVATAAQLDEVRNDLTAHYVQTANIDDFDTYITEKYGADGWLPIGVNETVDNINKRFTGSYDGGGHTISGLTINRPTLNEVGLFGCIGFGGQGTAVIIRNVHLVSIGNITGAAATGALVGRVNGDSNVLIEGCSVTGTGTVSGTRVTGGLVGANNSFRETPGGDDNPVISQCFSNIGGVIGYGNLAAEQGGKEKIGGLVGCNQKGTTVNSYSRTPVTISEGDAQRVGGLAGCTDFRGLIDRSYSTGKVSASTSNDVGGLVGALSGQGANEGQVTNSYWDTETSEKPTISAGGTGKSTDDMKLQGTFVNWNFTDVWFMDSEQNNGYPSLYMTVPIHGVLYTWTGVNDNDWGNGANWLNSQIPVSGADVLIPSSGVTNFPVLSAPASLLDLSIEENASLIIGTAGALTVNGTLLNGGDIRIKSDASSTGSLIHFSPGVNAVIERRISGAPVPTEGTATAYHMVSIPLSQAANPKSALFMGSYLYSFDAVSQTWTPMGPGTDNELFVYKGYMVYYPNAETVYEFSGPLNTGTFFMPVINGSGNGFTGFNLVPNPYPSAINWDLSAGWSKTNLNSSIWIWDPAKGQYVSYVSGAETNDGTQFIPVGQSFFVQAQASGSDPELTVNNDARVHSSQAFYKNQKNQTDELLRIRALANNYSDEMVVRFLADATPGHDSRFDAAKMYGAAEAPQLYSQAVDGQKLSIYSHPHPTENISIPVGFELEADGPAKLVFEGAGTFDEETMVLLEDLLEGKIIDLRIDSEYSFAHDSGNDPDRFLLHLQLKSITGTEALPQETAYQIFTANRHIYVNVPSLDGQTAEVEVFDLLGRRQQHHSVVLGSEVVLATGALEGIAIVRVVAGQQVFTQRVMIK